MTDIEDLTRAYTFTVDKSVIREKELEKENSELKEKLSLAGYRVAELKNEIDELKAQIEKLKFERSKFVDEIIDTAKGYGLVCDSCLFSIINEYDNKRISYDELLEKLQNDVIAELKMAIDDLRNGELAE